MNAYRRITWTERLQIEKHYNAGSSERDIAKRLGRSPSGIHYELQNGFYQHLNGATWLMEKKYSAQIAQDRAEYEATAKGSMIKLGKRYDYAKTVADRIKQGESPDAIVGDLKRKNEWTVSTPTLYRYIDNEYIPGISNKELLVKSKRKRHNSRKTAKRPPKGESIEKRPEAINDREEFGHWEQDTVIGKSSGKSESLLVLTERKTRNEIIRKLDEKTAAAVTEQLNKIVPSFPVGTFKSITVDNGAENQDYAGMKKLVPNIYYCHPYSSFERGSNENQNRIIRRFFPKGQSMADKTQADAEIAEKFINNMHRKILNYSTSKELFDIEVNKLLHVQGMENTS